MATALLTGSRLAAMDIRRLAQRRLQVGVVFDLGQLGYFVDFINHTITPLSWFPEF